MEEEWKEIEFNTNYLINKNGVVKRKDGNIVKPYIKKNRGYLKLCLTQNGEQTEHFVHRLIAIHFIPNPMNLKEVDHKNRDKLDNSIDNLEWTTRNLNCFNRHPYGKIKYKGVSIHKKSINKPYCAQITFNKKKIYIGCYETPEEAAEAYNKKALELYGDEVMNKLNKFL